MVFEETKETENNTLESESNDSNESNGIWKGYSLLQLRLIFGVALAPAFIIFLISIAVLGFISAVAVVFVYIGVFLYVFNKYG